MCEGCVIVCKCVCVCVWENPQRYFNFLKILNKHAAASVKLWLPVGFGLDGWRVGGGRCGRGSGGWGSSWSGPPPDTLAPRAGGLLNHHTPPPKPCQPRLPAPASNPNHSLLFLHFVSLLPARLTFPSSVSSSLDLHSKSFAAWLSSFFSYSPLNHWVAGLPSVFLLVPFFLRTLCFCTSITLPLYIGS